MFQPSNHSVITGDQTSQGEDGALNLRVVGPWASWPGGGTLGDSNRWLLQIPGGRGTKCFFKKYPGTAYLGEKRRYIQRDIDPIQKSTKFMDR